MSDQSSPSYSGPLHRTICRLRELALEAERQRSAACAWIADLEPLPEKDILAAVHAARPDALGTGFVDEALAAAYRALPRTPERSATWARCALHALDVTRQNKTGYYALALALRGNSERLQGLLLPAQRSFACARRTLLGGSVADLDIHAEIDHLEAALLIAVGRTDEATTLLASAATLWLTVGDTRARAGVLVTLGSLYLKLRRPDRATEPLLSALDLAKALDDPRLSATTANLAAEAMLSAGHPRDARTLLEESSPLPDDPLDRANRLALLGRIYLLDPHQWQNAETLLSEAQALVQSLEPTTDTSHENSLIWSDLLVLYALANRRADLALALPRALEAAQRTSRAAAGLDLTSLLALYVQHHPSPTDPVLAHLWPQLAPLPPRSGPE